MANLLLRPPLPALLQPITWLRAPARLGDVRRLQETLHGLVSVVVDAVLEYIDLDAVVARVDIDAVAARLDLDPIVDRLDLPKLARQVIDDIDLPEIIRESTGAMRSEAVVGLRIQSIEADQRVNRIVDRLLLRGGARKVAGGQVRIPVEARDATPR